MVAIQKKLEKSALLTCEILLKEN